ncbi:lysine N(6)-hydroxylase/L-ornithine N(5)-oxygenase family protein [Synechococcus sp. CS-602]|uniref:NAD(P)-binding domain-containing protein n=1 Tax=Synechococcaceae TaxID=1890426 RepID=UPI0011A5DA3E|nr:MULTISPECIES: FAD/NAD(P)-binding protein [Synechococcaceae]MCT4364722.1 lysine N(6)-hydroxylase/L-ornithine N(5)-oxygenase family protein [Candidatus Regnicoccus frigidus MAG-AL1]MCT0201209.1 lysine N(6)-hydroxylase/L-ornithine N(5)-oxygenase family protein [Synechococcus sp. CS-603]MCT0205402.1 lysine N(6)-hydroxylase/L-ornithine N(5)-oxygenase family protein [Synechococcus sp. CS-602]MCT0245353.1 lysine N(6)-hydroxylase/L-ornithine N(5)-oxygenase family protein [Synechococcus sp. CS-601]M
MAELVIAGAGPQALTLCCQLLQKRPQWRRQLRVLDPTGTWLSCWHSQMRRYEIPWLRSPSSHHPHPNPHALRRYAQERQRSLDLEGPYGLPHTSLFADFCRSVVADFQLGSHVQAASVQQIRLDQAGPASLEVTLSDGAVVAAHRLVIATGAGVPVLPSWARTIAAPHPAEAMQHSQSIDLAACQGLRGQHILIVGGGLTSGHLALGAIKRGARVTLLCRRDLRSKHFDADPGWLGPNYLKTFRAEPCWHRRRQQVLEARDGGSITPQLVAKLHQARQQGSLQLHEHCEVEEACWCAGQWQILCRDGSRQLADRIWLATGLHQGVSHHPLLRQLLEQRPIELIDDQPALTSDLRWPGTNVHLMGGLSALRLGPAARNLFGGREASQRICRAAMKA